MIKSINYKKCQQSTLKMAASAGHMSKQLKHDFYFK